jgi:hypothetical protein
VRAALVSIAVSTVVALTACGNNEKAECESDSDCMGTPCAAAACLNSTCVAVPLAKGAVASQQVADDCLLAVCDGDGNVVEVPDDDDLPIVTNPCVVPACSNGAPASHDAPAGSTCGSDMVCNATGSCVAGSGSS